jgi:hypothetical protein
MKTIIEDYVSFEIAKLLKEKGFKENCYAEYYVPTKEFNHFEYEGNNNENYEEWITAPTLQMAMKWLKETHNILIVPDYEYECDSTPYLYKIYRLGENGKPERIGVKGVSYDEDNNPIEQIVGYRDYERSYKDYSTQEEAINDGIKYCLEHLI